MTKTAFVTGATAGIGEATVRALVAGGWRCVATGRRKERLDALVSELGTDKVHPAVFDVRDEDAMDAAIAALPGEFAKVDLLVNNAGLAQGLSPAQEADLDDWQTMIDTNVTAMVKLTRKLLPGLIERKGAIIALGSVAGNYVYPGGNVYAGSKAFANHFTLALRADLHGTGVRVRRTKESPAASGRRYATATASPSGPSSSRSKAARRVSCWLIDSPPT